MVPWLARGAMLQRPKYLQGCYPLQALMQGTLKPPPCQGSRTLCTMAPTQSTLHLWALSKPPDVV